MAPETPQTMEHLRRIAECADAFVAADGHAVAAWINRDSHPRELSFAVLANDATQRRRQKLAALRNALVAWQEGGSPVASELDLLHKELNELKAKLASIEAHQSAPRDVNE